MEIKSKSKQYIEDITEVVRSLGIRVQNPRYDYSGKVYVIEIKVDENKELVKRRKYKNIVKIEKLPDEESQCIYVNNKSHLFITDGYNITHNTFLGVRYFVWCMLRHPDRSCFFVSHTAAMASKVYNDVISTIEESKNEIMKIFPRGKIVLRNAEQNFIRLENDSGNPYHTAYFRGIDGNMARSIGSELAIIL